MGLKKFLKRMAYFMPFLRSAQADPPTVVRKEARQQLRDNVGLYAPFLSPGDLCFDVGSNVGQKAEAFLALGARVLLLNRSPLFFVN